MIRKPGVSVDSATATRYNLGPFSPGEIVEGIRVILESQSPGGVLGISVRAYANAPPLTSGADSTGRNLGGPDATTFPIPGIMSEGVSILQNYIHADIPLYHRVTEGESWLQISLTLNSGTGYSGSIFILYPPLVRLPNE